MIDERVRALVLDPASGRALVERLEDGRLAWSQRREDDCMAAAVATLLQVPIEQVPDSRYDEQIEAGVPHAIVVSQALADMASWATSRGLRMRFHHPPPVDRDAWLAVAPGDGPGDSHIAVCSGAELVFDPAANWLVPAGCKVAPLGPVASGITFDRIES